MLNTTLILFISKKFLGLFQIKEAMESVYDYNDDMTRTRSVFSDDSKEGGDQEESLDNTIRNILKLFAVKANKLLNE